MTLGVAGQRDWAQQTVVWNWLDNFERQCERLVIPLVIVTGDAQGVDAFAYSWADFYGVTCRTEFADWQTHGLKAGPIRNRRIVSQCDAWVAFWDGEIRGNIGRGSRDGVRQAIATGIMVWRIDPEGTKFVLNRVADFWIRQQAKDWGQ